MDVDGTLTDGKIYMSEKGEVLKVFDVKDGYGIKEILIPSGVIPIILSGRCSNVVNYRAKELGIEKIFQGISNKIDFLEKKIPELNIDFKNMAHIGDDLNDIDLMKRVALSFAPSDATHEVKNVANHILNNKGGRGAVRECIEFIIRYNENCKLH